MNGVKDIISTSLSKDFNVKDVKFGFSFYEDMGPDLLSVKLHSLKVVFDGSKEKKLTK